MREYVTGIEALVRSQQCQRRERRITRPYEMVAAERVRAVAPRHGEARHHCARIGTILVNLEDGGRELRSISERRAPGAPRSEKIAPKRIEVGGERGARPRVGPAWAVRKAEREHPVVGARLGADCDRAVGS